MSEPIDPPRLVDPDSQATERIRSLLGQSKQDVATDAELAVLEARLAPMLGPPRPVAPHVAPATAGTQIGVALKLGAALVATAGAGTVWFALSRPHETAGPGTAPSAVVHEGRSAESATSVVEAAPLPSADVPVTSPEASATPGPSSAKSRPSVGAISESDLLGQAQGALAGDPGRALSLAEEHRRKFAHGVLVQEREVIAIEALSRLGRTAQAKARAEAFLEAFPSSAYRSKVEGAVPGK